MFTAINHGVTLAVYALASKNIWTEFFAIILSDGLLVLAFCAYVFVLLPLRRKGLYVRTLFHDFFPAALTTVLALLLKSAVPFSRPYVVLHFVPFVPATDPFASFPSLHVAVIAALATTLLYAHRRLGIIIAAMVPLVMLGRIAVGVHWLTDVSAGLAIGWFVAFSIHQIEMLWARRNKN